MARGMDRNAALFGQHGDERKFLEQKIRLEIEFDNSSRLRFSFRGPDEFSAAGVPFCRRVNAKNNFLRPAWLAHPSFSHSRSYQRRTLHPVVCVQLVREVVG